ncbi:MAG: alpha-amylase family protein [Armatimonadota bacterium]
MQHHTVRRINQLFIDNCYEKGLDIMYKIVAGVVLLMVSVGICSAAPVEDTAYGKAALRLEARPDPLSFGTIENTESMEKVVADAGVKAQWVSVVDPNGNPYYKSGFIQTSLDDIGNREKMLKDAVNVMHKKGLAVMSWYPLSLSQSGHYNHPDWRQVYIGNPETTRHRDLACCINSGYGDALINFSNEAIEKFGLDGIWFDGSAWTQIWDRPVPYSCVCDSCAKLFKKQTGLDLPKKVDWDDPVFRKWVAWRYDTFSAYIGKLAAGIRKKHPNAAVVINHYHRPLIPWQSAIPLNPYNADIISGSEGNGESLADLTMRLCRAYGRPQSEVWMAINIDPESKDTSAQNKLIHHALTCVTAGGYPSFGGNPWAKGVDGALKDIGGYLQKLHPYVNSKSVPYAAMHISQQTETFYLSRDRKGYNWEMEPFWKSVMGWTNGLMEAHVSPDYIYDKQFTLKNLSKYKVLLMPMSFALSKSQCDTVLKYARQGGTVVLGPWSGIADEWGEKRTENPFDNPLGFRFMNAPSYAATERKAVTLYDSKGVDLGAYAMLRSDVKLTNPSWKTLYALGEGGESNPGIIERSYGKGRIILSTVDMSESGFSWTSAAGGDTEIYPTDETSASGKRSLKFVDGPDVPQSFYPDMEINFSSFSEPAAVEGRVSYRIRLENGAEAAIESRDTLPKLGPSIHLGREGKLWAQDKPLCEVPFGEWFQVEMRFRLSGDDRTYDVYLRRDGSPEQVFKGLPFIDSDFNKCNWTVIFGEGTAKSAFYIDDVKIEAISGGPKPSSMLVFYDGFEGSADNRKSPPSWLASDLLRMNPAPVTVDAPPSVRMGAFRHGKSEVVVHLHNTAGSASSTGRGPSAIVKLNAPVKSAMLLFSGRQLTVTRDGDSSSVRVPSIPMQETVVFTLE